MASELIQWLSTIEDEDVLDRISALINNETKKDWWARASAAERKSIEKGIIDADNGKLNPHEKARDIYGKWL
jgi:predicted transcriptional regulator